MRRTLRNESDGLQSRIEVFFDGDCPLCKREVTFLTKRDKHRRIIATDIAHADFDASKFERSHEEFMATIQGRLADETWISGVEVFRNLYAAVGFTRLVRISRFKPLAWILDLSYAFFAKHRLRLTGRCASAACSIPGTAANDNESSLTSDSEVAAASTADAVFAARRLGPVQTQNALLVINHNLRRITESQERAPHTTHNTTTSKLSPRLN